MPGGLLSQGSMEAGSTHPLSHQGPQMPPNSEEMGPRPPFPPSTMFQGFQGQQVMRPGGPPPLFCPQGQPIPPHMIMRMRHPMPSHSGAPVSTAGVAAQMSLASAQSRSALLEEQPLLIQDLLEQVSATVVSSVNCCFLRLFYILSAVDLTISYHVCCPLDCFLFTLLLICRIYILSAVDMTTYGGFNLHPVCC